MRLLGKMCLAMLVMSMPLLNASEKSASKSATSYSWSVRKMLSIASGAAGLGILGISMYDSTVNKAPVVWKNVAAGSGFLVAGVSAYPYKRVNAKENSKLKAWQDSLWSDHINLKNLHDKNFRAKKMSSEKEEQLKIELAFLNDDKKRMDLVTKKPLVVAKKEKAADAQVEDAAPPAHFVALLTGYNGGARSVESLNTKKQAKQEKELVEQNQRELIRIGVKADGSVITGLARANANGFDFASKVTVDANPVQAREDGQPAATAHSVAAVKIESATQEEQMELIRFNVTPSGAVSVGRARANANGFDFASKVTVDANPVQAREDNQPAATAQSVATANKESAAPQASFVASPSVYNWGMYNAESPKATEEAKKENELIDQNNQELIRFAVKPDGSVITGIAREDGCSFAFASAAPSQNLTAAKIMTQRAIQAQQNASQKMSEGDRRFLALGGAAGAASNKPAIMPRFQFGSWRCDMGAMIEAGAQHADQIVALDTDIEEISVADKEPKLANIISKICELHKMCRVDVRMFVDKLKSKTTEIGSYCTTSRDETSKSKLILHKKWVHLNCQNEFAINSYRAFMPLVVQGIATDDDVAELCINLGAHSGQRETLKKRIGEALEKAGSKK